MENIDVNSVSTLTKLISDYGASAVFLALFLVIIWLMFKTYNNNNNKANEFVMKVANDTSEDIKEIYAKLRAIEHRQEMQFDTLEKLNDDIKEGSDILENTFNISEDMLLIIKKIEKKSGKS